jgi:MFS family permease
MTSTLAPVASLLTGVGFLIAGHGLQITLIPLSAAAHGWTAFEIAALGSAYYVGFVAGCFGAPFVILRAGHIRAFAAAVSLAAAVTVAQPLWVDFFPWIVFRAIIGASLAGLYMIIESWLNDRATNETRGLVMSAYIVVNFVGITVGQLSVTLYPPTDFPLFAIATMAIAVAAIPVVLTRSAQPAPITLVRFRPIALYRSSPVGVVGVTLVGVTNGAFWALGTVSALGAGLTAAGAAIFMSVATAGGALMQWPVGRFSDRVDRRIVLIALLSVAAFCGLVLAFVPLPRTGLFLFALFFGMATLPTYSIAAAHAYDHAVAGTYVETAAGILLLNALGAIVGPLAASVLIEETNASLLFLFIAVVQIGLAAFAFTRLGKRQALASAEKTDFDLAATAAVGMVMSPEPLDPDDPNVVTPPSIPAPAADEPSDAAG